MRTYYFSDVLNEAFDSKEACLKAEKIHHDKEIARKAEEEKKKAEEEAKKASRAEDAKKVETAYARLQDVKAECRAKINDADAAFRKELSEFCEKHHTYHWSTTSKDIPSLFGDFFNLF